MDHTDETSAKTPKRLGVQQRMAYRRAIEDRFEQKRLDSLFEAENQLAAKSAATKKRS